MCAKRRKNATHFYPHQKKSSRGNKSEDSTHRGSNDLLRKVVENDDDDSDDDDEAAAATTTTTTTTRETTTTTTISSVIIFLPLFFVSSLLITFFLLVLRATTSSSETKESNDHDNTDDDNSNSSKNDIIVEDLTTPREGEVRSTHKMFESESGCVVDSLREDPNMDGETHLDDLLEIGRSVDDFVDDGGPGYRNTTCATRAKRRRGNWTRTYRKKSLNAREGPSMGRIGRDVLFRRDREELRRPRALALIRRARVR